ncbi:heterokaryon incompatibility protein-domain-containing protein [Immersiella caudata]|uniref:Heterokaryon incompatibility protein-domain-containing protein n=1 Tax=Immersiella caudata TaxID=314043 RepID=A0AA39XCK3_9PEZI|nr:heterokaryon incompatibility protein-domain-containing protein [Immersiella caudata]
MASAALPNQYAYLPLASGWGKDVFSVRLLHLLPSTDPESPLRCHLIETVIPYHALSYTWGEPVFPETLEVTKSEVAKQSGLIQITENLHSALQNLRKPDETLVLWVDAVCINQVDVVERNSQVTNMPKVYSQAASVIVWLGRDPDARGHEALAMKFFQDLAGLVSEGEPHRYLTQSEKVGIWRKRLEVNRMVTTFMRNSGRPSLQWFLDRPWFRRRWIVQEVVLAKHVVVHCGSWSICWDTLERSMEELFSHRMESFNEEHLTNMQTVSRMRNARDNAQLLHPLETLVRFAHFDCADPRDRLYALYGIFQRGGSDSAEWSQVIEEVDYTLSIEELYANFTPSMIWSSEITPTAQTLSYVLQLVTAFRPRNSESHFLTRDRKFPSWVIDWTGILRFEPLRKHYNFSVIWSSLGYSSASSRLDRRETVVPYGNGGKCLVTTGISLDTVSATVPLDVEVLNTASVSGCTHLAKAAINDFVHAFVSHLDNMKFPSSARGNCYLYSNEHLMVVIARSLVADWHHVPSNSYFSQEIRFRREFLSKLADSGFSLPEILDKWPAYVELVALTMRGRYDTKVGDMVCLLNNSIVPFVLRPRGGTLERSQSAPAAIGTPKRWPEQLSRNNVPQLKDSDNAGAFPTFQLISDAYVDATHRPLQ